MRASGHDMGMTEVGIEELEHGTISPSPHLEGQGDEVGRADRAKVYGYDHLPPPDQSDKSISVIVAFRYLC